MFRETWVNQGRQTAHVLGPVYLDLVFTGLERDPQPGTEVHASGLQVSPGGVATVAVALARLGIAVGLSAVFSDDVFGRHLWRTLEREGVDLTHARTLSDWPTPVTVAISASGERAMVTHEQAPPLDVASLLQNGHTVDALIVPFAGVSAAWLKAVRRHGRCVLADTAWEAQPPDPVVLAEKLRQVDVFLPNAAEALAFTGAAGVEAAGQILAGAGVLAVITDGPAGAVATDPTDGTQLRVPAPEVEARDTTGAGDVFVAGFAYGTLAGWPLDVRLRFANLCAAESVKRPGGALSAPTSAELANIWSMSMHQQPDTP